MRRRRDVKKTSDNSTSVLVSRRSSRRNKSQSPESEKYKQDSRSKSPSECHTDICENIVSNETTDCVKSPQDEQNIPISLGNSGQAESIQTEIESIDKSAKSDAEDQQKALQNSETESNVTGNKTSSAEEVQTESKDPEPQHVVDKKDSSIALVGDKNCDDTEVLDRCELQIESNHCEDELETNQNEKSAVEKENCHPTEENTLNDVKELENIMTLEKNNHEVDLGEIKESKILNIDDSSKHIRKRKWITKKCFESKEPILAISTDSLKDLIAGVDIVPLSDIKFDSSSEVENSHTDLEEGEKSPTPEPRPERRSRKTTDNEKDRVDIDSNIISSDYGSGPQEEKLSASDMAAQNSPPETETGSILYITNLVRPFTVLQLKGLLARTGKIVEDGFWIDRIKSKCYVKYETEDQAVETRHALHGVRWPVSNPKCLTVEFGKKEDMERAIQSSSDGFLKFGVEYNKDEANYQLETVKKNVRPVREWDVGKKDSLEKVKKREKREHDRNSDRELMDKTRGSDQDYFSNNRENGKDRKYRREKSRSFSPAKKSMKKENDPPIRLLDDLFRKTKTTPCIYWLPLTPEQIAEKESFRLKRIEEHKERVKQRELERIKLERERDRDRERGRQRNDRDRERVRDSRRHRSSDRRRSRSRERRRY